MKYVVTGAAGFLGWHTRVRLLTEPGAVVVPVTREDFTPDRLADAVRDTDVVLHLAGINRASDQELHDGNVALASTLVDALERTAPDRRAAGLREPDVVYAGSNYGSDHHPGRDTPYGRGKREAGQVLLDWADRHSGDGASAADLRFCGLFGEHGRPDYNSYVANFAHRIAAGEAPSVTGDRELPLLHVGEAVTRLLDAARERAVGVFEQEGTPLLISAVADRLQYFHDTYAGTGEIPDLTRPLDVELFNTLRAAMWPHAYPLRPTPRSDERGTLVETVRVHGGTGQAFLSSTNPGFTRGNHYHHRKIERFQVISGTGLIRLRKVLDDEVIEFPVTGDEPAVVDMPTLWTHSITNVGDEPLVTFFWTNELFDPDRPDTWPCGVLDGPDRPTAPAEEAAR